MADEFVRKDVFDARMDRLENIISENNARLEAKIDSAIKELRGEIRENITKLEAKIEVQSTRIDALNMRIESVQTSVYWGLAIMGLILAFATFIPSILDFLRNLRRPSLTTEDVKLLISEILNSKEAKV